MTTSPTRLMAHQIGFLMMALTLAATCFAQQANAQQQQRNRTQRQSMFDQLDANGDGKIEKGEVDGSMWFRLSRRDSNGDGAITPNEVSQLRRPSQQAQTPTTARPGGAPANFDVKSFQASTGNSINYSLFVPQEIQPDEQLPLVLCLHGGRGATWAAKVAGGAEFQQKRRCFVMAPACEAIAIWVAAGYGDDYSKTMSVENEVMEAIDDVIAKYPVDPDRLYVTGQSKGGHGTWGMISKFPDRFAAAAPVCGPFYTDDVSAIAELPIWIFHGNNDQSVPVEISRKLVAALREAGASPGYTEFPGVGHNSWIPAYSMDVFWDWLFEQRRGGPSELP